MMMIRIDDKYEYDGDNDDEGNLCDDDDKDNDWFSGLRKFKVDWDFIVFCVLFVFLWDSVSVQLVKQL